MRVLSPEKKSRLLALREQKEVGRFLLPDAPERKQKRKSSPPRIPCPLIAGTPITPPARKRRPWEVVEDEPVPSTSRGTSASSPPSVDPLFFDGPGCAPSSKDVTDKDKGMEETVETMVQEKTPSKKSRLLFPPSTGIQSISVLEMEPNRLVDADIELLGFTSTSSTRHSVSSPIGSPSSVIIEPSKFDDTEGQIAEWELNIGQNAGSDLDDEIDDIETVIPRNRDVDEYPVDPNDLSPHLLQQMDVLDAYDDSALSELVGSKGMLNFAWSNNSDSFTGVREQFTGPSGPTFSTESMTPLDIFERIWDETIINLIVSETNKYANQLIARSNLQQNSRLKSWTDVTKNDVWIFFGILMLQSFVPNPVEKEYWYPLLPQLKIGSFKDIMPFKKFILIKKCLHFVDNGILNRTGKTSRLQKIKPIIDHLGDKFSSLYLPEQNIAIDESLLLWKGRLSFAQLIATKAARVGIKSYELCESRTGYLWKMEVYAGKDKIHETEGHDVESQSNEPEGATSHIVYRLVRPLLDKGHTLVMDNFYNSPLLSRTLKLRKTDTMGTLRLNRQFVPDSLRSKTKTNMRTGEIAFSQTQDLSIVVWRDSNLVSLISTYHKVEVSGKEKYGIYKYKPKVVLDYNLAMGGVDKKDQLLQAFPMERTKNAIWYKKLFRRLLNISIHNSFIIFSHTQKIAQRQFRVNLVDLILQKYNPPRLGLGRSLGLGSPKDQVPKSGHFPIKTKGRTRCKLCAKKKIDTRTVWACDTCDVSLCIIGCFKTYHTS